jgi:6,7-dimethyl-8-ribityllumazine synthase
MNSHDNNTSAHLAELRADGLRVAIVVARFNSNITEVLLQGAIEAWKGAGGDESTLDVARVPGAFELPIVAQALAQTKNYDSIVCLGCVIRGDTDHYNYVCDQTASGIMRVGLDSSIPVIFGVLTTDNLQQALDRAGGKDGNKGADAIYAAIETATLLKSL